MSRTAADSTMFLTVNLLMALSFWTQRLQLEQRTFLTEPLQPDHNQFRTNSAAQNAAFSLCTHRPCLLRPPFLLLNVILARGKKLAGRCRPTNAASLLTNFSWWRSSSLRTSSASCLAQHLYRLVRVYNIECRKRTIAHSPLALPRFIKVHHVNLGTITMVYLLVTQTASLLAASAKCCLKLCSRSHSDPDDGKDESQRNVKVALVNNCKGYFSQLVCGLTSVKMNVVSV